MALARFHEDLGALDAAADLETLTHAARKHADALGFTSFIYALRVPTTLSETRMVTVNGYPDAWLERYFSSAHYTTDPTIAHCQRHVVPIAWSDVFDGVEATQGARTVMNEAAEFGLRDGLSTPVHGPRGELGIFSLARDRHDPRATALARPYAQLFAAYLHEAVHRVLGTRAPAPSLTAREIECLKWAADGKTSWEIATLLDMAERTVNFHLANATTKLDVSNRQHAIAKAVLLGLLRPHPF